MKGFALSYCFLFLPHLIVVFWRLLFFKEKWGWDGGKGGWILGKGELEDLEGGKTITGMYCKREKSIF